MSPRDSFGIPADSSAEERLRQALEARAERVRTSPDALLVIRARVRRDVRRRRGVLASASALATAAVAAVTAILLGLGLGVPVAPPVPSASLPTTAAPTPTPGPTTTGPPAIPVSEPIYLVATTNGRTGLYREYHPVPGGSLEEIVVSAVINMIEGAPLDPDYRTLWPAGTAVRSARFDGNTVVVDLGLAPVTPSDPSMALQQLIHTVTAVTANGGRNDLNRVQLLVDGTSAAEIWGVDTSAPLVRGGSDVVLARVWLSSPQHGATVDRTFTVQMQGTVFEAGAVLRIRRGDGSLLEERPVQLDNGPPARGLAEFPLTLAAGTYTLEAFYYSAQDGSVQSLDNHTITVR